MHFNLGHYTAVSSQLLSYPQHASTHTRALLPGPGPTRQLPSAPSALIMAAAAATAAGTTEAPYSWLAGWLALAGIAYPGAQVVTSWFSPSAWVGCSASPSITQELNSSPLTTHDSMAAQLAQVPGTLLTQAGTGALAPSAVLMLWLRCLLPRRVRAPLPAP
mmetsp:Transcript_38368/g.85423  ORF Transcript_38368/g.85423 Transcript_38368/m.85423 type:complete len:162 (-) Transcript_38368:1566-2051(-)